MFGADQTVFTGDEGHTARIRLDVPDLQGVLPGQNMLI